MDDIIIIGAGVTGAAIARELSRYAYRVHVLERAADVCEGTSKANSGIVHAGYDARPGTWKARLNVEGNALMPELAKELDFAYRNIGSLVLCMDDDDPAALERLYEQGVRNGVKGLRILDEKELFEMEPGVSKHAVAALYAPTAGVVCPFGLTIALAENAAANGVTFHLNTEAGQIEKIEDGYRVGTDKGDFFARMVVNAAGVYADRFHNMVSADKIHITPRRGEYCLMDKNAGNLVRHTLFQLPARMGKGVLVTPTVHGNLLCGPTADEPEDPEAVNTTAEGLKSVFDQAGRSVDDLPARQVITSFAGLRAHEDGGDFILGQPQDAPGFFDATGIESPGLTCAPAIGRHIAGWIRDYRPAGEKADFAASRKGIFCMAQASNEERARMIAADSSYANVVCRCELVTEGEILDAIRRPLGATTLDGIKRRTRAGMGRCQAGFCTPKTVEILARELGRDPAQITKNQSGSEYLTGFLKEEGG